MNREPFVVTPTEYPRALDVIGVSVTVLASNTATASHEITLQEGAEGAGPPPHRHDWDESFYVLRGSVEISCEGKTFRCEPGTLVFVPGGTLHGYRFGAGGGGMLEISGAGGLATQMFTDVSEEIPPGPPDVPKLLEVLRRNGVRVEA